MIVNTVWDDIDGWPLCPHSVWLCLSRRFTNENSYHTSMWRASIAQGLLKLHTILTFLYYLFVGYYLPESNQANSRQRHATSKNLPRSMQEVLGIIKESLCTLSKEEDLQNLLILIYKLLNYCFVRL